FDLGRFVASLDLEHVDRGLQVTDQANGEQGLPFTLLQIEAPSLRQDNSSASPVDFYSRGRDLVATYRENAGQQRRLQVYWRALEASHTETQIAVLELVVSVQTDLLDSNPAMYVASRFPTGEIVGECEVGSAENDQHFVLVRPATQPLSIMQAVHPSDRIGDAELEADDTGTVVRHPLFAEQLEKGVIRRARARVAILPRERDLQLALDCFDAFAASEPVLTA
ncbi:MAG: hypothetical protein MI757_05085, partial [Pirellulales bacterium]|nr:hypothetical protein [Pirellulales bacterium]